MVYIFCVVDFLFILYLCWECRDQYPQVLMNGGRLSYRNLQAPARGDCVLCSSVSNGIALLISQSSTTQLESILVSTLTPKRKRRTNNKGWKTELHDCRDL